MANNNFHLYWQTIKGKKIIEKSEKSIEIPESLLSDLNFTLEVAMNIIDEFDLHYGRFCERCISEFSSLSEASKLSSGRSSLAVFRIRV